MSSSDSTSDRLTVYVLEEVFPDTEQFMIERGANVIMDEGEPREDPDTPLTQHEREQVVRRMGWRVVPGTWRGSGNDWTADVRPDLDN